MSTLTVTLAGIEYRADTDDPHTLARTVDATLTALGFEAWVQVPADLFAPNLARLTTWRADR